MDVQLYINSLERQRNEALNGRAAAEANLQQLQNEIGVILAVAKELGYIESIQEAIKAKSAAKASGVTAEPPAPEGNSKKTGKPASKKTAQKPAAKKAAVKKAASK